MRGQVGLLSGRVFGHGIRDGFNVCWAGTATAADNINELAGGKLFYYGRHRFWRFVVFAKFIWKPGIRVGAYISI